MRMQFFALGLLLKALCGPESIERFAILRDSHSDGRKKTGLLLGYGLVVKATLYRQIELIITVPGILGLKQLDEDLIRWWDRDYSETKYANRFRRNMRNHAPPSALIGNYLNNLLVEVNRSGNDLERFSNAAANVFSFAETILSMIDDCRLVRAESGATQDINQALRLCAAEYLHDFIYERKDWTLNDAYAYARADSRSWGYGSVLEDFGMSEIETSRDIVGRRETTRHRAHPHLPLGINAAVAISLYQMGLLQQMPYRESAKLIPDAEIYGRLLDNFHSGRHPSLRYELALQAMVPEHKLDPIMSHESSPTGPREQLSDLLGNRAFLTSGLSSNADFHFQVLIRGLLNCTPANQTLEVLRIDHSGEPDEPHPPVSLAVLVGGDWQVFYCIDALGRMKSKVWPFLRSLISRIRLVKIEGVNTNDLLRQCDHAFQYVASQLKAQQELNSHLRGTIPELLAGLLLASKGYHPLKISLEMQAIGGKDGEIDAIGFRETKEGGEYLLIETKKGSVNQNELRFELEKFVERIEFVRQNSGAVGQALGCSGSIQKVSGLFVTLADVGSLNSRDTEDAKPESYGGFIDDFMFDSENAEAEFKSFLDSLSDVDFWDYNRFNSELSAAGLPKLPIRLLEPANMSWELPATNIDDWPDVCDILAQAVKDDNWQWPDSIDAVQTMLDEMLRGE